MLASRWYVYVSSRPVQPFLEHISQPAYSLVLLGLAVIIDIVIISCATLLPNLLLILIADGMRSAQFNSALGMFDSNSSWFGHEIWPLCSSQKSDYDSSLASCSSGSK